MIYLFWVLNLTHEYYMHKSFGKNIHDFDTKERCKEENTFEKTYNDQTTINIYDRWIWNVEYGRQTFISCGVCVAW